MYKHLFKTTFLGVISPWRTDILVEISKLNYNEPLLQVDYVKKLSHFTKYGYSIYRKIFYLK